MAIDVRGMNLSKWEARLFEQREEIEAVKKGLYRAAASSLVAILFMIFMSRTLSKEWLVAVFAVYMGWACFRRICYGLSAIGYKQLLCKLVKQFDR